MKKILPNNKDTEEMLSKLPKIYIIGLWARWGVMEFPFVKLDKNNEPLVYHYDDRNGTADQYELVPLRWTTTGGIWDWTFRKGVAEKTAEMFNERDGLKI